MMYYYLCSSLPSLAFGKSAPLTAAEFDALCAESLAPAEYERLLSCPTLRVPRDPDASLRLPPVYAAYARFEQYLRTRIAQRRTGREEDKAEPLPDPAEYFGEVDFGLGSAASADPLEREKLVDRIRWNRLDDLGAGHEFDFDALCVYRLRLLILDKYRDRRQETGRENFEAAAGRISGAAPVEKN